MGAQGAEDCPAASDGEGEEWHGNSPARRPRADLPLHFPGRAPLYGMVNVDLYSAIITKVCNALDMLVSGEKPGFQTLSEGLVVLLCAEVVRQRVPDHGAVHSECSASDSG